MKTFKELFISEANLTGKTMKLKKDYAEYKKGTEVEVLEFKGSGQYRVQFPDKKTDVIGVSVLDEAQVSDKKLTWDDAHIASLDAQLSLEKRDWKIVKRNGKNSFKIIHDNGCVGTVVFDPSLKESLDELDESVKVGDGVFSKNDTEINGRVKAIKGSKVVVIMYDDEDKKEFEVPMSDFKRPMKDGNEVTWDFPTRYFKF